MIPNRYERLRVEPVRATAARLTERIEARLPGRQLAGVARELVHLIDDVGSSTRPVRRRVRRATVVSRAVLAAVLAGAAVVLGFAIRDAFTDRGPDGAIGWLPLIEATVNDLVFVGLAVFFLRAVPARIAREHLLGLLHRLRSLAHIVDMHQLTKDPERVRATYARTEKSAEVGLDADQVRHYLDYCSELLSLIGKAAALCAEESRDDVILETVSTIEALCTGLSGKIWQKIGVLDATA